MKGSSTEKAHSSRVGKNWVTTGLCRHTKTEKTEKTQESPSGHHVYYSRVYGMEVPPVGGVGGGPDVAEKLRTDRETDTQKESERRTDR